MRVSVARSRNKKTVIHLIVKHNLSKKKESKRIVKINSGSNVSKKRKPSERRGKQKKLKIKNVGSKKNLKKIIRGDKSVKIASNVKNKKQKRRYRGIRKKKKKESRKKSVSKRKLKKKRKTN